MQIKYWSKSSCLTAVVVVSAAQVQAAIHVQRETTIVKSRKLQTDEDICANLIQDFYLPQDDETGSSLARENDICSCQLTDDGAFFVVECRFDYCQECNEAGVCGLVALNNRYNAATLREGEADSYFALADFSSCVEYSQVRSETACVITNPQDETCSLEVDGVPCNSCTLDETICPDDAGGLIFDCTNLEGGIVFNSCNEVSDTTQAVDINSPFAFADNDSLVFQSCTDPNIQVTTPPPTSAPLPGPPETENDSSPGPAPNTDGTSGSRPSAQSFITVILGVAGTLLLLVR